MGETIFSASDAYVGAIKQQLQELNKQDVQRVYLQVGGRLIGDKHAARVLPGYNPDTKLHLIQSVADQAEYVYCISADDLDRGRVRGDNGLSYADEICRSLDELSSSGIAVRTIVVVGTTDLTSYDRITSYAEEKNIPVIAWATNSSVLDESFSVTQFADNERLLFNKQIVVVLSPGSNSGKFDFCLQQLYLDSSNGQSVAYARLQVFPIPALHPWHPVNLAYFAATADVYGNEGLFTASSSDPKDAWSFYQKDANIDVVLHEIQARNQSDSHIITRTISVDSGFADESEAEREGAAELLRRYMRYRQEVAQGKERLETLEFTKRLINLLFDRYPVEQYRESPDTI